MKKSYTLWGLGIVQPQQKSPPGYNNYVKQGVYIVGLNICELGEMLRALYSSNVEVILRLMRAAHYRQVPIQTYKFTIEP